MTFWTVYILSLSAAALVISGIPLRSSDLGQNGHIVHYHWDKMSGGHRRHIHYRPAINRIQASSRNTFFQNHGTPVNPAAIYEVPSNRHYNNDAVAGRLAVELRSLVTDKTNSENINTTDVKSENNENGDNNGKHDNNNGKHDNNNGKHDNNNNGKHDNNNNNGKHENGKRDNNNNGKLENGKYDNNNGKYDTNNELGIHSVQNRDAPTPPNEALPNGNIHFPIEALPHGLQFLNRQSQERQLRNQANNIPEATLDLNTLLGDIAETTTTPSITPSDAFLSTGPALDLGFLLGDMASTSNSPERNLGHQGHSHGQQSHGGHGHQGQAHSQQGHHHGNQGHGHSQQGNAHSQQSHGTNHGHKVQGNRHEHVHEGHNHGNNMISATNKSPNRNSIQDKVNDPKTSGRLGNLFNGMFNQQSSVSSHAHDHSNNFHHEVNTAPSTNTVSAGIYYQKSTVHARPITKRGVSDSDSVSRYPKTFVDNILNIRIGTTVPPPAVVPTTQPTRYSGYLTTPRSIETQIERLSGVNLNSVRHKNRGLIRKNAISGSFQNQQETTTPAIVTPSQKELVHLQGIHIMFSDGKQDKTGTIPTVHLTASLSENVNHLLKMASGGSNSAAKPSNINSITEKITGTAVIRDGHLYLVVYPFGNNKSLELHYNQTTKRIPMPRNKPVPFADINNPQTKATSRPPTPVQPTVSLKTSSPRRSKVHITSLKPTSETKVSSTSHHEHHHGPIGSDTHSTSHSHAHVSKPDTNSNAGMDKGSHAHEHHQHAHSHRHHGSHTPSLTGLKLSEVNDTTLQTLLAPIDNFMSPWDSLNFSKVFPYSAGKNSNNTSSKKSTDEDTEVDVVTFIAKATDPFNRMKTIIETLVNKTLLNTSASKSSKNRTEKTAEARFNFELNLKSASSQNIKNTIQSTTNPNNSEEKAFDTNIKSTTVNSKLFENLNQVTESVPTTDFSTTGKPFVEVTKESLGMFSGESTTPSKSIINMLNEGRTLPTSTKIMTSDTVIETTSDMPTHSNRNEIVNPQTARADWNKAGKFHSKLDGKVHLSDNSVPSTARANKRPTNFYGTTMSYIPNYTKSHLVRQPTYEITTPSSQKASADKGKTFQRNMQASQRRDTVLGSNLQPFVQRTSPIRFRQGLNRGQSEQIISLADILNDIRRIQLHNMQRFNIQNNNFDTMILSESQQQPVMRTPLVMEGPVIRETSTRRYSDFPSALNNRKQFHKQRPNRNSRSSNTVKRRVSRDTSYDPKMEATVVLTVDDVMTDQTELHGAIVISHRRNPSSRNKT